MVNYSENRISWIDSCKGLASIFVVIGHIADGYIKANLFSEYSVLMQHVYNILYSFHMPLFFCLSGYVFCLAYCRNPFSKNTKLRIQILNLIYIYILMCCVQWFFKFVFADNVNTKVTVQDLLFIPIKPISPYWYLYVMIFYYLICIFLVNIKISEFLKVALCVLISMIGSLVHMNTEFPLHSILMYIAFFYFGIFLAKSENALKYVKKTKILAIGGIGSIAIFISIVILQYNLLTIDIIGIFGASIVCVFVIGVFAKTKYSNGFLDLCGKCSLEIYIIHCFITAANRTILIKLGITSFYINVGVNLLMAIFIPIGCAFVLKKLKLHTMVLRPFSLLPQLSRHKASNND